MHVTVFGGLGTEIVATLPGSPLAEGTMVASTWSAGPGGSACRQAHATARFGCSIKLLGVVGMDAFDTAQLAFLAHQGGCLVVLDASGLHSKRALDPIPADWVTTDARSLKDLCCAWDIFGIGPADKIRLLAARLKCGVACYMGREGALASLTNGEKVAVRGRQRANLGERAASAFSAGFGVMMRETADPVTALRYAASAGEVAELECQAPDFGDRDTVERAMLTLVGGGE